MPQVWIIHGGDTFDSYEDYLEFLRNVEVSIDDLKQTSWPSHLGEALGPEYKVLASRMPNSSNAKYIEWKLWFDKLVPLMNKEAIVVGHSLGGLFLAKYLAENTHPTTIQAAFLIAAPHRAEPPESLADFIVPHSLEPFQTQSKKIFLYHSQDDPVVPFADLAHYTKALPNAIVRQFTNHQHFNQPELPELIADIKSH